MNENSNTEVKIICFITIILRLVELFRLNIESVGVTANGPAIRRAEREVPTCYVGIARSQTAGRALPDEALGQGPGTLVRQMADHGARILIAGRCALCPT